MPLDAFLAGYAGLACIAMGMKRHRPVPPLALQPSPGSARATGIALLALSLLLATSHFTPPIAIVAWIGQICLAGGCFVLLQSWKPRLALTLALPMLGCAFLF